MIFANEQLKEVARLAIADGIKVYYCDEYNREKIEWLVLYEPDSKKIGSVEVYYYSGIRFATIHKPSRENGSGFSGLIEGEDFNTPKDYRVSFLTYPYWMKNGKTVEKYKDIDDYFKKIRSSYKELTSVE